MNKKFRKIYKNILENVMEFVILDPTEETPESRLLENIIQCCIEYEKEKGISNKLMVWEK